jgi:hypothetical protein
MVQPKVTHKVKKFKLLPVPKSFPVPVISPQYYILQHRPKALLKAAVAKKTSGVSTGTLCTDGNILFYEGAQRLFVTKELAEGLELIRTQDQKS